MPLSKLRLATCAKKLNSWRFVLPSMSGPHLLLGGACFCSNGTSAVKTFPLLRGETTASLNDGYLDFGFKYIMI